MRCLELTFDVSVFPDGPSHIDGMMDVVDFLAAYVITGDRQRLLVDDSNAPA